MTTNHKVFADVLAVDEVPQQEQTKPAPKIHDYKAAASASASDAKSVAAAGIAKHAVADTDEKRAAIAAGRKLLSENFPVIQETARRFLTKPDAKASSKLTGIDARMQSGDV
jgi:hypothetical protein